MRRYNYLQHIDDVFCRNVPRSPNSIRATTKTSYRRIDGVYTLPKSSINVGKSLTISIMKMNCDPVRIYDRLYYMIVSCQIKRKTS